MLVVSRANTSRCQGFAGAQAAVVTGDGIRLPVRWANDQNLSPLAGKRVRLRIHLQEAKLYALWTE